MLKSSKMLIFTALFVYFSWKTLSFSLLNKLSPSAVPRGFGFDFITNRL